MGGLLRRAEAAVRLGLSERMIDRMTADGRLPVVRTGRAVRIPEESVDAYVASLMADKTSGKIVKECE